MEHLKKLTSHFKEYWDRKGVKNNSINSNINRETTITAAEAMPPAVADPGAIPSIGDVPQAVQEPNPVLESVVDLDTTVEKEVGKKVNLQIRRTIEDAVRRYLGPMFNALEKAIKPKVDEEVQEQSAEVKQDIKQVIPGISDADMAPTETGEEEPKEEVPTELDLEAPKKPPLATPPAPPAEEEIKAASLKTEANDQTETKIEQKTTENTSTTDTKEEIRVSHKEDGNMFKISYHQGDTFEKSYFVATDGKEVKVVSATRVIPTEVQAAIAEAEEKDQEAANVISPEEAAVELEKEVGGTMDGFKEWSSKLPKLTREADLKREAEWAINEGEITKVEMPKKGEVIQSVSKEESKMYPAPLPSSQTSKVKQYYGRLPNAGPGATDQAINQQSSVNDKYLLVKRALEDEKAKNEILMKEKDEVSAEASKLKDEQDVEKKRGLVTSILGALKKDKPMDAESEKTAVDMLIKADAKSLNIFQDVLQSVGGDQEIAMPPVPQAIKSPVAGINLPPVGAANTGTTSLIDIVSKMLDH